MWIFYLINPGNSFWSLKVHASTIFMTGCIMWTNYNKVWEQLAWFGRSWACLRSAAFIALIISAPTATGFPSFGGGILIWILCNIWVVAKEAKKNESDMKWILNKNDFPTDLLVVTVKPDVFLSSGICNWMGTSKNLKILKVHEQNHATWLTNEHVSLNGHRKD